MIPTKYKNRRQKAKEALAKAIKQLIDNGWSNEAMQELCSAYMAARVEKVL